MKKNILLIRHAMPDFPGGIRLCLGSRTDIGISEEGRAEARLLGDHLFETVRAAGAVYSSPLKRAIETAEILARDAVPVLVEEGLKEMDAGEWDGLDFDTIKSLFEERYQERDKDMSITPPGGDEFSEGSARMRAALKKIACSTNAETIVAVAHAGVNRAFLSDVMGIEYKDNRRIPQKYTSVNYLTYDTKNDSFRCDEAGFIVESPADR